MEFETSQGYMDSALEGQIVSQFTGQSAVDYSTVFAALSVAGGSLVTITSSNQGDLDNLNISADAKARIAQEVENGMVVQTPNQMVMINGTSTVEWLQYDLSTGRLISVAPDGSHQAIEYIGTNK